MGGWTWPEPEPELDNDEWRLAPGSPVKAAPLPDQGDAEAQLQAETQRRVEAETALASAEQALLAAGRTTAAAEEKSAKSLGRAKEFAQGKLEETKELKEQLEDSKNLLRFQLYMLQQMHPELP